MSNIFEAVNENGHKEWLYERAKIIVELEAKLPQSEWTSENFPLYIHSLRPMDYVRDVEVENHELLLHLQANSQLLKQLSEQNSRAQDYKAITDMMTTLQASVQQLLQSQQARMEEAEAKQKQSN